MEAASCPIRWNISVKKNKQHVTHRPRHPGCSFRAITGSKAVSDKERSDYWEVTFEVIFRFFLCLHVWSFNAFRKVHPNCGGYQNNNVWICASYSFTGWNLFWNEPGSVTQRWHDAKNQEGRFFVLIKMCHCRFNAAERDTLYWGIHK